MRTEQLGEDTLYGASAEDGKGMATVGSDDEVFRRNGRLETDGYRFL